MTYQLIVRAESGERLYEVTDTHTIYFIEEALRRITPRAFGPVGSFAFPEPVGEGSGTHHENTGACLCTSFRGADDDPEQCKDCQHARHYSRPYCGGLK